MTCRIAKWDGGQAIICSRKKKRPACRFCGKTADRLCDFPNDKRPSGTCDAPVCSVCSRRVSAGVDHCPDHFE